MKRRMSRRASEAVRASVCIEGLESRTLLSATAVGTPTLVNATKLAGPQSNESMAISQTNPQELFVVSDNKWSYRDLSHARTVVGYVPADRAEDHRS